MPEVVKCDERQLDFAVISSEDAQAGGRRIWRIWVKTSGHAGSPVNFFFRQPESLGAEIGSGRVKDEVKPRQKGQEEEEKRRSLPLILQRGIDSGPIYK